MTALMTATASAQEAGPASPPAPEATTPGRLTGDWGGRRSALAEKGLKIDLTLTAEAVKNFRGGLDTEMVAGDYLLNLGLTLDTKPSLGIDGGTFYINLQSHG